MCTCAGDSLWPVDDEGINVVQLEILQGLHQVWLDMFWPVVRIPQLGLDEKLFSLYNTSSKQLLKSLTNDMLIVIVIGTVNESVTSLHSSQDSFLRLLCRCLPCPKPQPWHLGPIVQGGVEVHGAVVVVADLQVLDP